MPRVWWNFGGVWLLRIKKLRRIRTHYATHYQSQILLRAGHRAGLVGRESHDKPRPRWLGSVFSRQRLRTVGFVLEDVFHLQQEHSWRTGRPLSERGVASIENQVTSLSRLKCFHPKKLTEPLLDQIVLTALRKVHLYTRPTTSRSIWRAPLETLTWNKRSTCPVWLRPEHWPVPLRWTYRKADVTKVVSSARTRRVPSACRPTTRGLLVLASIAARFHSAIRWIISREVVKFVLPF